MDFSIWKVSIFQKMGGVSGMVEMWKKPTEDTYPKTPPFFINCRFWFLRFANMEFSEKKTVECPEAARGGPTSFKAQGLSGLGALTL